MLTFGEDLKAGENVTVFERVNPTKLIVLLPIRSVNGITFKRMSAT